MDALVITAGVALVATLTTVALVARRRRSLPPPPSPLEALRHPTMPCPRCGRPTRHAPLPDSYQPGSGPHPHLRCEHCHAIIG